MTDSREQNSPGSEAHAKRVSDEISEQFRDDTSNGNRMTSDQTSKRDSGKLGSAQRGGPDLDKAASRQPPDANTDSEANS